MYAGLYDSRARQFHLSTIDSRKEVTPSQSSSKDSCHRDSTRGRSKHSFYAVNNGLKGDEIYTSWRVAAPHCWDCDSQNFINNCICQGFASYDAVGDWLISMDQNFLPQPDLLQEPTIAPPGHQNGPLSIPFHSPVPQVVEDDNDARTSLIDTPSISTKDFNKFLSDRWMKQIIPSHVSDATDSTTATDSEYISNSTLPFLTSGSSKALPTYTGKTNEDINNFFYKLHPTL